MIARRLARLAVLFVFAFAGLVFARTDAKHPVENTYSPSEVQGAPKKTPSKVEYWDIIVGTGAIATSGKTVGVHYTGWLADGTKFDSSVDRGKPIMFPLGVGKVIRGWDEGIVGMKVGGKRQLRVPPSAGYGSRGAGAVPPNAVLIFDITLLAVGK
ncbi:MAG TPA: FKBP-type peptidyl-prolyl cis-trans isomerase [Candidatus Acidoferrales bacterium]|nr:FKBP-type peptidyl-prolyl cis-trans isomerase [Candidatus Acidoferrales bacterium]